jgi:DinB superfamily
MPTTELPEVWLRGRVEGYDPLLMPVVHALLQVHEDIDRLVERVPAEHVWLRPGGAASIGFHIRHTGGALDRLFTYARGEVLSDAQKVALRAEEDPGEPPPSLSEVAEQTRATMERAFEQLRATPQSTLLEERRVGRAGMPSNVLGLLFHAAEHSTRHIGQAITTARILSSR